MSTLVSLDFSWLNEKKELSLHWAHSKFRASLCSVLFSFNRKRALSILFHCNASFPLAGLSFAKFMFVCVCVYASLSLSLMVFSQSKLNLNARFVFLYKFPTYVWFFTYNTHGILFTWHKYLLWIFCYYSRPYSISFPSFERYCAFTLAVADVQAFSF